MNQKLKKIIQSEFRRSNVKVFLFFLAFSGILWLLVQFSKTYTYVVDIPVKFENYPKDKLIEKKGDKLSIQLEQSGFQLAWLKFANPEIALDLSELPAEEDELVYSIPEHRSEWSKKIPIDLNRIDFLNKEIKIPFQLKSVKKVPVISRVNVSYAPGYSSEDTPVLQPDSIQISGSKEILDTVQAVYTREVNLKQIDKNITQPVKLDHSSGQFTLYQEEVNYQLPVEKFTERTFEIPLEMVNVPANTEVVLFPPTVSVTFMVSIRRYNQIKEEDLKVVCDYKEILEDQNFFIPQLTKQPSWIKNTNVSPKKIQYIVKK